MTPARRPKKQATGGMVLRWQRALQECRDVPDDNPSGQAVIAVAAVLVSHADPDGRHCRPAVETMVWQARASKRTVRLALDWLVEYGWLEVVRRTGNHPTEYRLTVPVPAQQQSPGGADEHQQNQSPLVPTSTSRKESAGAAAGALAGAHGHHDLRTSEATAEEEEERAVARSAVAPLAARLHDLFTDSPEPVEVKVDDDVVSEVGKVGARVGAALDSAIVGPAFQRAMERTGCSAASLGVGCAEKFQRNASRIRDPSRWLAKDLDTRVSASMVPSPRMKLADALARLWELEHQLDDGMYLVNDADSPQSLVEERLTGVGLLGEEAGVFDGDVWDVKPAHVEQYARIVDGVINEIRQRLKNKGGA